MSSPGRGIGSGVLRTKRSAPLTLGGTSMTVERPLPSA
jgi:hypothetical protein